MGSGSSTGRVGTAMLAALWLVAVAVAAAAQTVPTRESQGREKPAVARLSGRAPY